MNGNSNAPLFANLDAALSQPNTDRVYLENLRLKGSEEWESLLQEATNFLMIDKKRNGLFPN